MRRFTINISVLAALTFTTTHVCAADPPNQDSLQVKVADLFQKARAHHLEARWKEAEAAYQEAWNLRKSFDIAGNLGDCELHVDQAREAAEHLTYALDNFPAGGTDAQKTTLKARLAEALAKVARVRVRINVEGARLILDRRKMAEKMDVLFVDPGPHTLVAWREGYQEAQSTLQASAGSSHEVSLSLMPLPAEKRAVWPIGVMGGVGGAALIAGIALMIDSKMKGGKAGDLSTAIRSSGGGCAKGTPVYDPRCEELHSLAAAGDAENRAGIGLLVGAGAVAAGTLLYVFLPLSKTSVQSGFRVTPSVSISQAGLSFAGAF